MPVNGLSGAPVALVMFDLDGTLLDTVPDIAVALNAALADLDLPVVSVADVRAWVGNGARVLCARAISRALQPSGDAGRVDDLLERFLSRYAERVCVDTRPYDGAVECLDALSTADCVLACITNKPERHTRELLATLQLQGVFGIVVGGDTLAQKKPDPLPLVHAMQSLDVAAANAIMVGDSATDVAAARAAGVRSICVNYGYNRGQDVNALGADLLLASLRDLPGLLRVVTGPSP